MKEKITVLAVFIPYYIGWTAIGYGACKLICWAIDKIEDRVYEYKKTKKNHG